MREVILQVWVGDEGDEAPADLAMRVESELFTLLKENEFPAGVQVAQVVDGNGSALWDRSETVEP